jgi:hypothetical protein
MYPMTARLHKYWLYKYACDKLDWSGDSHTLTRLNSKYS